MKVVVVDDASFMRKVYAEIVKMKGHDVVGEASNGNEAIEIYKKLMPDLIIMDVVMPDVTGLEAVKEIISFDPKAKIIVITGADEESIRKNALEIGAKGFLRKPPDAKELGELLNKISLQSKVEDPRARMVAIYASLLREVCEFLRTYFKAEDEEALVTALLSYAEGEPDIELGRDPTITLRVGGPGMDQTDLGPEEVNERLNALMEVGRKAIVENLGGTHADEVLREAFKLVYQRTSEGEIDALGVMFPPWLEAEVVRMEKANSEATLDMLTKRYDLVGGHIYLMAESHPKESYHIFSTFSMAGTPAMVISRASPREVRDKYGTGPARMIWLTHNRVPDVECIDPAGRGLLYKRISEFVRDNKRAIVILDGLEYMISQTNFGSAQKFLQAVNDDVMLSESLVLIPFNTNVLDEQQVHFLSRELKMLEPMPEIEKK